MSKVSVVLLLALAVQLTFGYLPGVNPKEYQDGDPVQLKVNKLTSTKTQVPYPYYSLPFCAPETIIDSVENLGEILLGDKIENSDYKFDTHVDVPCKVLCSKTYTPEELSLFAKRIEDEYRVHWFLDSLPAAVRKPLIDSAGKRSVVYEEGFPLGRKANEVDGGIEGEFYINNHINFNILFHTSSSFQGLRIVGFEVNPESIAHDLNFDENGYPYTCTEKARPQSVSKAENTTIVWTYSVQWEFSNTPWASRWDIYLLMTDDQIHWFSIINSMMIVLFLTGMVAMIMMRTLNADLKRYREMEDQEEAQEETGWKLVHGDVFRPPARGMLLAVLVGTGIQILSMAIITMMFAVLGFLSPANRGALMTALVVLFVLCGLIAGYFSARLYKMFKGQQWKKCTLLTAMLFPGIAFGIFFVLNMFLASENSTGAVPFGTLVSLVTLWFGISLPLTFFGSYFGFKKPAIEHPCRTNQIPRQIPEQVWYMRPLFSILMGGILPFGAVFIELFFILSSIWLHQFYYIFGFLSIVIVILILTCAEISIVMCYFQLCSEDYHWWWRSYMTSGASAFYMFLYSIFYFFTKLHITRLISILLYFGYTFIMVCGFFTLTGAIGFFACFFFVRKIYSSVKVD